MNKQSFLFDLKEIDVPVFNSKGIPLKKPLEINKFTYVNKGKPYPYGSERQGFLRNKDTEE